MKYVAKVRFRDLKDNGRIYEKGEPYPRKGKKADEARIKELCSSANKAGFPLIEAANEEEPVQTVKTAKTAVKRRKMAE